MGATLAAAMPLRLTDRELAVAVALVEAPGHALLERADAQAQLAGLRHAGVVRTDGSPDPDAAATLRVVARPIVRVELRRSADEAVVDELRAWADEEHAVSGRVEGGAVELRRLPRAELPSTLVRTAGLMERIELPEDDERDALTLAIGPGVIAEGRRQVRAGRPRLALEHMHAQGLEGLAADYAFGICECLRSAFVAQGSWRGPEGEWHAGTVAGLDAGELGWWSFTPGGEGPILPTTAEVLMARLFELLP